MKEQETTFSEILKEQTVPAIAVDQDGIIFFVNSRFEEEYGWSEHDLTGEPITTILPPYMRDAHNIGFSRFLATEARRILDKEIELSVYCKDATVCSAKHFITAKKIDEEWKFAALVKPVFKSAV